MIDVARYMFSEFILLLYMKKSKFENWIQAKLIIHPGRGVLRVLKWIVQWVLENQPRHEPEVAI